MERSRIVTVALIILGVVTVINGRGLAGLNFVHLLVLSGLVTLVHLVGLKSVSFQKIGPFSPILSFVIFIGFLLVANAQGEFSHMIPSFESLSNIFSDAQDGVKELRNNPAPFQYSRVIFLVLITAVWSVSEIGETLAQRLHSCAPTIAWFVLVNASLAAQDGSPWLVSIIVSVAGASWFFLYAFERGHEHTRSHVISIPSSSRYTNAARISVSFLAIVLVSIILALPVSFTPSIGPDNVFNWLNNSQTKTELSPLVSMSQQLKDQKTQVLFRARATEAQYFRVGVLDDFDGEAWSVDSSTKEDPEQIPPGVATRELSGSIQLEALEAKFLPTFYSAQSLSIDQDVSYLTHGVVLSKESDVKNYSFNSLVPPTTLSPELIEKSSEDPPASVESSMLLPGKDSETGEEKFDPAIIDKARSIAQNKATLYDQVIALRDFFLDGSFTYDLDVSYSSDTKAMQEFLTNKRGFCEQFATTYAAMVRSIGIPARVVVGFTPGEPDATGQFTITNKQAHAWVEVYLSNFGWLTIDPTPAGSLPGQAPTNIGVVVTTTTTTTTTTATVVPSSQVASNPLTSTTQPRVIPEEKKKSSPAPIAFAIILLLGAVIAFVVWKKKTDSRNDDAYIISTFKDIGEKVLNVTPPPDVTIAELAERIDEKNEIVLEFLALLTLACYAPEDEVTKKDLRIAASKARSVKISSK